MRWLDGTDDSTVSLSKLWETVKGREAWHAAVHGIARVRHDLLTKQQQYCCIWGGLSIFWQFVVPLYSGGSSLWVGLYRWLVKVFWLRKLVSVF